MEQLYQDNPRHKSTFTLFTNWSLTDSLESHQNRAWKERLLLIRNGRVPTQEIVLHFLKELPIKDIIEYRTKIFRVLKDNGLEAVVSIELTRGKDGKPNNTVHFHVLTDDERSESELRELFEMACERQGLVKDIGFCISCRTLWDGCRYFDYFTKYRFSHEVVLFQKDTGLHKFYTIGKWFGRSKEMLWKEYVHEKYGANVDPDKIENSITAPDIDNELSGTMVGKCVEVNQDTAADKENVSPQSIIPQDLYPRPWRKSQRALAAHDELERSKSNGDVPRKTIDDVAKEFIVSEKLVRLAGKVKECAAESMVLAMRAGTIHINKFTGTAQKAKKATGIATTPSTSLAHESPFPNSTTQSEHYQRWVDFNFRIMSGECNESDNRKWQRYMDEGAKLIALAGRRPVSVDEYCELFARIDQEP